MKNIIATICLAAICLAARAADTNLTITVTVSAVDYKLLAAAAARTNAAPAQLLSTVAKRAVTDTVANERTRQEREGLESFRKLTDEEKSAIIKLLGTK